MLFDEPQAVDRVKADDAGRQEVEIQLVSTSGRLNMPRGPISSPNCRRAKKVASRPPMIVREVLRQPMPSKALLLCHDPGDV